MSLLETSWQLNDPNWVNDHFDQIALHYFKNQSENNLVYKNYLNYLKIAPTRIGKLENIPFLPISLYKSNTVKTGNWLSETVFKSSGTTGSQSSQNHCKSVITYQEHCEMIFEETYGPLDQFHFLALLPNYLTRGDSSLVAMMSHFIEKSQSNLSGFYLTEIEQLVRNWKHAMEQTDRKVMLWGVSFALWGLAESHQLEAKNTIVVETGGMKGRRKEILRSELHEIMKTAWNLNEIHSEYGMTELASQAYSMSSGLYRCPAQMKVVIKDLTDPFVAVEHGMSGKVCIIDLGNYDTCCFIETSDLGRINVDGTFEILGRIDGSEARGCNLMVF